MGWLLAGLTVLVMLGLGVFWGHRVRWGWLTLLVAAAGVALPRDQSGAIGPALFTGALMCLVLWAANREDTRAPADRRPRPGTPERDAQLILGLSGERHVGQVLARELPDDFVLVNGLKLPHGAGDIDHVVVGPSGVFVLETKTMAGRIECEADGTWRRTRFGRAGASYSAYIGNPATQVQRNIFAVRQCLRRRLPHLFHGTPLWIEGLIVFPHPRTELQTERSRVPAVLVDQAAAHMCLHSPQRRLQRAEVDAVLEALLTERQTERAVATSQSAQALVELALILPLILSLALGALAVSRVVQTQASVIAVAQSAARAGALADTPADAVERMRQRATLVAPGVGLDPHVLVLESDVTRFGKDPGTVVALVRYRVNFGDLAMVGWMPAVTVQAEHAEWVDPFRSGVQADSNVAGR
jgi:Flp pilus assembly protein TadG